jgi:Abnormal spindle-like microcephaly-assoc'd, ASPM-SPD-2-Hydin
VLLSPDALVITANSAAGTVFTKTKVGADGGRYLFAYNYTASPVTAEFTLAQPAAGIIDYDTGATSAPDTSTTFSGVFQPYQAHVFQISNSAPVRTPVPSPTPTTVGSPTPSTLASATPSSTPSPARTVTSTSTGTPVATPTATATMTPTPTLTATATVSATPTATATPGALSVLPAKLKFGAQKLGTTSRAKNLKVTNDGGAPVGFTGMPTSGDFVQTNTCGASLPAHGTCIVSIIFGPTAMGARRGSLTLRDNAVKSPQIVELRGNGKGRR